MHKANFVALNIAYEEESEEEEIDDSKELQIEEALKLYQNALKLHSQGPAFFDEAGKAYEELFRSEIFTYVESLSETQWLERFGDTEAPDDALEEDLAADLQPPTSGGDGAPSTLPQILYLAYKNYGQFRLDRLQSQLDQIEEGLKSESALLSLEKVSAEASNGLRDLTEALDRDEGDLELWRKVARVGEFLGSRRTARFSLEAILNADDVDTATEIEPLSIEEILAKHQMGPVLASIDPAIVETSQGLSGTSQKLIAALQKHIDPCPFLPAHPVKSLAQVLSLEARDQEIRVAKRTWASCGKAILLEQKQQEQSSVLPDCGARYVLKLPPAAQSEVRSVEDSVRASEAGAKGSVSKGTVPNTQVSPEAPGENISSGKGSEPSEPIDLTKGNLKHSTQSNGVSSESAPKSPTGAAIHEVAEDESPAPAAPTAEQEPSSGPATTPQIGPVSLPTRKRSSETAELQDGGETGRGRSKRIKARGSMTDPASKETAAEDWSKWYKQQLEIYVRADRAAFASAKQILTRFGCSVAEFHSRDEEVIDEESPEKGPQRPKSEKLAIEPASQDLSELLDQWDYQKSKLFLAGDGARTGNSSSNTLTSATFSSFLAQSNTAIFTSTNHETLPEATDLDQFTEQVNEYHWDSLGQVALRWVQALLEHGSLGTSDLEGPYEKFVWPEDVKQTMVHLLVTQDDFFFEEMRSQVSFFEAPKLPEAFSVSQGNVPTLVQVIFELHLDIYGRITNPSSEVDMTTRKLQCDRLSRWALLANTVLNRISQISINQEEGFPGLNQLQYRFLWASTVLHNLLEPSETTTTVAYFHDLIRQFKQDNEGLDTPLLGILLPNNAIMPEISLDAAEREISRLTTLDFFTSIFSSSDNEPESVIEHLEPLLLLSMSHFHEGASRQGDENGGSEGQGSPTKAQDNLDLPDPRLAEALHYLNRASISLKLFLWRRLQDAYSVINYPPKILSCNLWCMILIVEHLQSHEYTSAPTGNRRESLLVWLHKVDELMTLILALAYTDVSAFESVDYLQIQLAMTTVAAVRRIVHGFAVWEDTIRVGQIQPTPQPSTAATKAQLKSAERFREIVVKTWTLQYVLIKEASNQDSENQPSNDDLVDYLRLAHEALGLRTYCGLAHKSFLKLIKAELLKMRDVKGWVLEMPQVIFDLYGLRITSDSSDVQDHSCDVTELDKSTALEVLDLVMLHVNRISMKELLKNDLKYAVDKMQQVIRIPKASGAISARAFNKRLINNYLKTPINPVEMLRSLRGVTELCSMPARSDGWDVAAKGWYYLVGHLYLVKFRSQKRVAAGSLEDLETAKMMFKQDLEFDTERWETWYRLAQAYDSQIDESVTWSAEKLQNDMTGLIDLQRKAILCYSMAISVAKRCGDLSFEGTGDFATLHADFGLRLYASTREPFSMKAFGVADFKKQFSGAQRGMYEGEPFKPLSLYRAWKLASTLLVQAAKQRSRDWNIWFNLGKVLWKMHDCEDEVLGPHERITFRPAIDAFVRAIECLPERRDSRHPDKDPILEPHYKLTSIVHKLVRSGRVSFEDACSILKTTPYASRVSGAQDSEDWERYILAVLKALRSADKSNWHHRMVAKAAHVIYEENTDDMLAILGAKHELTQQIFTKTMAIQVWKPDNERPGRHFVYTGRYVRFFVELLYKTNDKENLEMLARRIRKKAGEFVDHYNIWHEVAWAYLKTLRSSISVQTTFEETVFRSTTLEEFQVNAMRLESWAQLPTTKCPQIEVLRDVIEFKKLNNNLMKVSVVEDLIADIYASIYDENVPDIKAKDAAEESRVRMSVDNILMNSDPPSPHPDGQSAEPTGGAGQEHQGPGRRRATTVSRREIIRKAEALAVRAPISVVPKPAPRAIAPAPDPGRSAVVAVVIPYQAESQAVSPAGSVNDDADDESELSDVDGIVEEPERLLDQDGEDGEEGEEAEEGDEDEENERSEREDKGAPEALFPNLRDVKAVTDRDEEEEEEEEDEEQEEGSSAEGSNMAEEDRGSGSGEDNADEDNNNERPSSPSADEDENRAEEEEEEEVEEGEGEEEEGEEEEGEEEEEEEAAESDKEEESSRVAEPNE